MSTWSSPRLQRTGVSSISQQRASVSKQQTTSYLSPEGPWAQAAAASLMRLSTVWVAGSRQQGLGVKGSQLLP